MRIHPQLTSKWTWFCFFHLVYTLPLESVENHYIISSMLQYLKEQRLPPLMFIPLQSVLVKPTIEKLRTLGGSAQLVFDVIQYPFFNLINQFYIGIYALHLIFIPE